MLAGLFALGLVMFAFGSRISDVLDDRLPDLVGIVLAIVPALLWRGVFRELDRLEPEPHQYLLSVTILAVLLYGTFDWLVTEFSRRQFGFEGWPTVLAAALFALMVLGVVYGLLKQAVRETRAGADRMLVSSGEH